MTACEAALVGKRAGEAAWREAAQLAIAGAASLPSNAYKLPLLQRTVARALALAGEVP
ncbi:MAG TPA: hypothetical protein VMA37_18095 [Acetobacteraceae bacterium]|nr:hypothetical protein [Acetobacteraceae bacterium]